MLALPDRDALLDPLDQVGAGGERLGAVRGGASDADIAMRWRGAMWNKQAGHGIDADDFVRPERSMGAIGG